MNYAIVLTCLAAVHATVSSTSPVAVFVGTSRGVYKVTEGSTEGSREEPSALTGRRCYALDYHYANSKLYVATDDKIISLSADSNSKPAAPTTVVRSQTRITSLAVDWLADVLYYVTDQRGAVRAHPAAGGEGDGAGVVLEADAEEAAPNWDSLVVDPYARKLFWLGSGGLHSSGLGGEELNVTQIAARFTPYRISIDTQSKIVYVIAGATGGLKLLSCHYDGSGIKELLSIPHTASTVYGFGVIGNVVYWESNFDGENLFKTEIPGDGSPPNITTFYEINKIVSDVKIYHPDLQRPKETIDTKLLTSTQKKLLPNAKLQKSI